MRQGWEDWVAQPVSSKGPWDKLPGVSVLVRSHLCVLRPGLLMELEPWPSTMETTVPH